MQLFMKGHVSRLLYITCCLLLKAPSCSEMSFLRVQTQRLYGFAFCLGLALLFGTMVSSLNFCMYRKCLACCILIAGTWCQMPDTMLQLQAPA